MPINAASIQGYALTRLATPVNVAEIHGYALTTPPAQLALRRFQGYVMGVPPNSLAMKTFNGYAMAYNVALPKGVDGKTGLMNMILAVSKTVRPATHFSLGAVEAYNDPNQIYNSRALLTALPAAQLSGSMYFYYNRTGLARMGSLAGVVIGNAATTQALIPAINAATGMTLTTADIIDEPIAAGSPEVTITAASTSYFFTPGDTCQVGFTPTLASQFKTDTILWS